MLEHDVCPDHGRTANGDERLSAPAVEPGNVRFSFAGAWLGCLRMLPLVPSIFAVGVVFGVLAREAGISMLESALMSTAVNAGSAQFVALGLWSSPVPIAAIILSTFILNLRQVLMGATLRSWLQPLSPRRAYASIATLTDASWALTAAYINGGGQDRAFLAGTGLTLLVPWVGGTIVGQLVGARVPDPARWGLDFAFTAALLALLVPLWRGKRDLLPWIAAGLTSLLFGAWIPGAWNVLIGGLAGALLAGLRHGR